VSDKVFTIPNLISFLRLCLAPVFFVLLLKGLDLPATLVFALAACTDWIDGQVARRTNSVSRLGQLIDPAIDRILMAVGVIGLALIDRLPLWVVFVVVARDLFLLLGGLYLLSRYRIRIPVIYLGKATTVLLLFGFVGLLLNWPLIPGLGACSIAWLPGFNANMVSWGIWFIYIGLVLGVAVAIYYIYTAVRKTHKSTETMDRPLT